MSRHHTLPPIVTTPEPPRPKETRRRRGLSGVWRKRATDESEQADDIDDGPPLRAAPRANGSPQGTPIEAAERHIPSTSGKLSADTLKVMLEAQEVMAKDETQS